MTEITKERLYELYWDEQLTIEGIAERFGVSSHTIRNAFENHGIPRATESQSQTVWVMWMRTKEVFYEDYWVKGCSQDEIADRHGVSRHAIRRYMDANGIPTRPQHVRPAHLNSPVDVYMDDESADGGDDGDDELPDDPDPSKYLAEPRMPKDRIYELYWGFGLTVSQSAARLEVAETTLRDAMERKGVPRRDGYVDRERAWKPMDGVPPSFEWPPDEDDEDGNEFEQGIWRKPAVGD